MTFLIWHLSQLKQTGLALGDSIQQPIHLMRYIGPSRTYLVTQVIALYLKTGGKNSKHESVSDSSSICAVSMLLSTSSSMCMHTNFVLFLRQHHSCKQASLLCSAHIRFFVCSLFHQKLLPVALNLDKKMLSTSKVCLHMRISLKKQCDCSVNVDRAEFRKMKKKLDF